MEASDLSTYRQGVRFFKNLDVEPIDGLIPGLPTTLAWDREAEVRSARLRFYTGSVLQWL